MKYKLFDDDRRESYFDMGFQFTSGGLVATVLLMFLAIVLFIPGFIIVNIQNKKPKEQQNMGMKIFGYILMVLGCVLGIGLGFSILLGLIGGEF